MDNTDESPIMRKLREMMLGAHPTLSSDMENTAQANAVEPSTDTIKGMAEGGIPGVEWVQNEMQALLDLQKKPLDVPDETTLNKPVHTGVYQPKLDLSPAQEMTAASVKPKDTDIGFLHDDMSSSKPLKGLFMTKRFADGGVVQPQGPSDEEKRDLVAKALQDGSIKMADGGLPQDPALPPDAPQESKLQAILKAMGMAGSDAITSILPGSQKLANAVAPVAASAASAPGIASAVNAGLGTNLEEPAIPPAAPPLTPAPMAPPAVAPAVPHAGGTVPPGAPKAPAANPLDQLGQFDANAATPGLNPGDRQALAGDLQKNQHTYGNYLAEALAGIGDSLAARGGVQQNSLGQIFGLQTQQRQEALDNFDKARQSAVEHFNMKNQADAALISNLKARGELQVSPSIAKAIGHPELAGKPVAQAEMVIKSDAMKYDYANKMQERKQGALKNASDEVDKALTHGGMAGTQKMMDAQSRLRMIHSQAIKNDPEAFGYHVSGGK